MRLGGLQIEARTTGGVVTDGVVGCTGHIPDERQERGMVACIVEVFVAAQAFAGEQVGVEPFHSGGAVFVVDVDHEAERRAFGDDAACLHIVHRCTVFEKSELDALDAEFAVYC